MREQNTIAPQISSEPILRAIVGGLKTQPQMRQFNVLLARILLCTQQKIVLLGTKLIEVTEFYFDGVAGQLVTIRNNTGNSLELMHSRFYRWQRRWEQGLCKTVPN